MKQKPWKKAAHCSFPLLVVSLLSYIAQDHLPRDGTVQSGRCPLTSIINAPTDMPTSQPDGILQLVLLPRPVNLTTKISRCTGFTQIHSML